MSEKTGIVLDKIKSESGLVITVTPNSEIEKLKKQTEDSEATELRQIRRMWKEEQPEFNRLKNLALVLGVEEIIVSPPSALPDLRGLYIPGWSERDSDHIMDEWGLSKHKIRSLNYKSGTVILVDHWSVIEQGACHVLAHEIGHRIYQQARFTADERKKPVTQTMRRLFPYDTYVHQSRDEICAESFAHYLTGAAKESVLRHCDSVLRRVPNKYRCAIRAFRRKVNRTTN